MNRTLGIVVSAVAAVAIAVLIWARTEQGVRTAEQDTLLTRVPAQETLPSTSADTIFSSITAPVQPADSPRVSASGRSAPPPAREDPPRSQAQSGAAAQSLKQAAAAYSAVRALRADFVQRSENPLLNRQTTSRGTVMQRQPDRFLMRFSQPAGDVVVSDGQYFWVYYPSLDAKQVLRTRAGNAGGLDLQAQFIGDPTRRFNFTDHGLEDVAGRAARVITLDPKEPAGYRTLKVWIDERDHLVRRFELTNENGVVQHFQLSNLQVNPTLADSLFRFTPPAGARIIER